MPQFYFLSILTNLLAGFVLVSDRLENSSGFVAAVKDGLERPGFRVGLGFASFLVGFFKLLTVTAGDVRVVGDLFPALTGLLLGSILVLGYYKERTTVPSNTLDTLDRIFLRNETAFGVAGIVAGTLHFFMPTVLFL